MVVGVSVARSASHCLNAFFERPSTRSSSREGPVPSRDRGEVDDDGDVLLSAAGVPPHVLTDPDHGDGLEPAGVLDQGTLALLWP